MLKKCMAVIVVCLVVSTVVYAYKDLPAPQDPVVQQTIELTSTDLRCKVRADELLRDGKFDLAVAELRNISNAWVYHWFLSYIYERQHRYGNALEEIDWLIPHSQRKDLTSQLIERKKYLEIKWKKHDQPDIVPQPVKKGVLLQPR